jgi:hypothetical protein
VLLKICQRSRLMMVRKVLFLLTIFALVVQSSVLAVSTNDEKQYTVLETFPEITDLEEIESKSEIYNGGVTKLFKRMNGQEKKELDVAVKVRKFTQKLQTLKNNSTGDTVEVFKEYYIVDIPKSFDSPKTATLSVSACPGDTNFCEGRADDTASVRLWLATKYSYYKEVTSTDVNEYYATHWWDRKYEILDSQFSMQDAYFRAGVSGKTDSGKTYSGLVQTPNLTLSTSWLRTTNYDWVGEFVLADGLNGQMGKDYISLQRGSEIYEFSFEKRWGLSAVY